MRREYVRSTKSWDKNTGAPIGGLQNWMYSDDHVDDGYLGGREVSDQCYLFALSSRCFDHKDYKNDGEPKVKERSAAKFPYEKPEDKPVVGGGVRGSRKGVGGDKDHFPTCPSK
ncbi:ABC transporter ATP-binding protein [Venturia inaequalis]|nr:ABC transporter ATP-binding protein [Venturia inaequalis]